MFSAFSAMRFCQWHENKSITRTENPSRFYFEPEFAYSDGFF